MTWQDIRIVRFGGPEVLEIADEPNVPEPGPGEVRIKVLAAGTGFADSFIRRGRYNELQGAAARQRSMPPVQSIEACRWFDLSQADKAAQDGTKHGCHQERDLMFSLPVEWVHFAFRSATMAVLIASTGPVMPPMCSTAENRRLCLVHFASFSSPCRRRSMGFAAS